MKQQSRKNIDQNSPFVTPVKGTKRACTDLGDTKSISRLTGPTDPDFVGFEKIIMLVYYRKTTGLN